MLFPLFPFIREVQGVEVDFILLEVSQAAVAALKVTMTQVKQTSVIIKF